MKFYTSVDVTFFENVPFYLTSSIQEECELIESHNWETARPALPQFEPIEAATKPSDTSKTPPKPSSQTPTTTTHPYASVFTMKIACQRPSTATCT